MGDEEVACAEKFPGGDEDAHGGALVELADVGGQAIHCVEEGIGFCRIVEKYERGGAIWLWEFHGYDNWVLSL